MIPILLGQYFNGKKQWKNWICWSPRVADFRLTERDSLSEVATTQAFLEVHILEESGETESILLEYPFLLECMIGRMEIDENVIILPYQAEFGNCSSKHIGPYEARTLSLKRIESVYRMDAAKLTSLASATGGSKYDFLDV